MRAPGLWTVSETGRVIPGNPEAKEFYDECQRLKVWPPKGKTEFVFFEKEKT